MIDDFILQNIIEIIKLEDESIDKNYCRVRDLSLDSIKYVKDNKIELPVFIYRFLDDFDIRKKDHLYHDSQTKDIRNFLLK